MKKINYFGKEYTVSDDIKWVATCSSGNVIAFTEMPKISRGTWVVEVGTRIDICGAATADWENSLRKVEDILVKENKLKVGDKVELLGDYFGFKKGQIVELYRLRPDGIHLFKGSNDTFSHCNGEQGAYLSESDYTPIADKEACDQYRDPDMAGENKSHPHADLMLKYAMIAQYDDKPWESFECALSKGGEWCSMVTEGFCCNLNYRLKPQEPKIQIGQVWKSEEGINVVVDTPSDMNTIYLKYHLGGLLIRKSVSLTHFTSHFKHKE